MGIYYNSHNFPSSPRRSTHNRFCNFPAYRSLSVAISRKFKASRRQDGPQNNGVHAQRLHTIACAQRNPQEYRKVDRGSAHLKDHVCTRIIRALSLSRQLRHTRADEDRVGGGSGASERCQNWGSPPRLKREVHVPGPTSNENITQGNNLRCCLQLHVFS